MNAKRKIFAWLSRSLPDYRHKTRIGYRPIDGYEGRGLAELFGCLKSSAYDDRVVNVERYWRNGYDGDVERGY